MPVWAQQETALRAWLPRLPRYLAAVGLMMLVARRRLPRIGRRDLARVALIALSGLVAFNLCVQEGVARSDAASVGVVVGCVPIVLALLGPLQRGERPRAALLAAGAVVAAGAAFVQGGGARFTLTGVALALGAMACEAALTGGLSMTIQPTPPRTVSVTTCACDMSISPSCGPARRCAGSVHGASRIDAFGR